MYFSCFYTLKLFKGVKTRKYMENKSLTVENASRERTSSLSDTIHLSKHITTSIGKSEKCVCCKRDNKISFFSTLFPIISYSLAEILFTDMVFANCHRLKLLKYAELFIGMLLGHTRLTIALVAVLHFLLSRPF